jgi:hypothetical protein
MGHRVMKTMANINLVGGFNGWWYTYPSEKNEFVSWDDDDFSTEWKVIKFHGSKPPTRYIIIIYNHR